ncbi:MAG: tyrosine--tRNA ligase [Erysipelotrichia bacterium]|jgi:tyrosyl-tRNA synthetase|nr:tyrosine--tRNA ligase [Bacilli bacterium]NLB49276.1 tyrosine--tRNA ligase [Erysipelotrichia bacterium]
MHNILEELEYRDLIKDFSNRDEIKELLDTKQTIYCGFDPSMSSLHVGNYVMISFLKRLQKAGHKIIAIVGGGTGMIGDPSGKSKERNLQTEESLKINTQAIKEQLERFIDLSDPKKGMIINNYEWLSKISLLDFLRDYGKYFPINYLLAKDTVASRLESGISYTEFSYSILQAIDFLMLFEHQKCAIQVGGSDQWGNLTSGLELIRKVKPGSKVGVMTCHLITRADGKKFGKSESGALFLNKEMTSPYQLYQYFINAADEDAIKYLKVFTFLSKEEIEEIEKNHLAHPENRIGQKVLAYEVVKDIHSLQDADEAVLMSEVLFSGDVLTLNKKQLEDVLGEHAIEVQGDKLLEEVLIEIKAASSKREARQFCSSGAITVNGERVSDPQKMIVKADSLFGVYTVIRRGKKLYFLVKHV